MGTMSRLLRGCEFDGCTVHQLRFEVVCIRFNEGAPECGVLEHNLGHVLFGLLCTFGEYVLVGLRARFTLSIESVTPCSRGMWISDCMQDWRGMMG